MTSVSPSPSTPRQDKQNSSTEKTTRGLAYPTIIPASFGFAERALRKNWTCLLCTSTSQVVHTVYRAVYYVLYTQSPVRVKINNNINSSINCLHARWCAFAIYIELYYVTLYSSMWYTIKTAGYYTKHYTPVPTTLGGKKKTEILVSKRMQVKNRTPERFSHHLR